MTNLPKRSIPVITLLIFLAGCLPKPYQHDILCLNREVPFCEDFESSDQKVQSIALSGSEWYVDREDRLIKWGGDLPLEGRSPQYLASVGLLLGEYQDNSRTLLFTPPIDLSDVNSASLNYNLLYLTEKHWDGMIVVASLDQGSTWIILEPEGGYPGSIRLGGEIIPGYSGFQPYWSHESVDLFSLVGREVMLGFYFLSDWSITDHGIALDDIVVNAIGRVLVSENPQNFRISDLTVILPQDPLLSVSVPAAIAIIDTPCENGELEILEESNRAYVKAVNQTEDRYQVLHPDSGNFCWVWFEDVWIDQEGDFPILSDLTPEDIYLPFCSLSKSPILSSPDCIGDASTSSDADAKLRYHLSSALVERGLITTLLIDPGPGLGETTPQDLLDLRIGDRAALEQISPVTGKGGDLKVVINGALGYCSFDALLPGRVICYDGLVDAAGPLQVEICWQGWDNSQICPPGLGLYQGTSGCFDLREENGCMPECPPGYFYNNDQKTCVINRESTALNRPDEICPEGFRENKEAACCVFPGPEDQGTCPEGYDFLAEKAACHKQAEGERCPEGLTAEEGTGACLPQTGKPQPLCTTFEVQFPEPEVTVKQSTICRKGPGKDYETVSSLAPFSVVKVLGTGAEGEYLVISNPSYQTPCWAILEDFYWDKLDFSILPVFSTPPFEE